MTRLALIAAVATILAGCGSGSEGGPPVPTTPTPLSHAQFTRAGNGLCTRYYRQNMPTIKSHPKTLNALATYLRNAIPPLQREDAGFRALVPPRKDAGTYRHLLRVAGLELREAHSALHAFETGQVGRGVLIARHLGQLDKPYNSLSRRLGLTVCGLTRRQVIARFG